MKRLKNKIKILISLLLAAAVFTGCAYDSSYRNVEKKYVVGVVTKSNSGEYWMSVISGIRAAAKKYNTNIILMSPDSELKKEVQDKMIMKLIEKNADAVAISPIDSYDKPEYMKEIEKKGIFTVTFDTGFNNEKIPYIGIDNRKTGFELAKALAKKMNHEGKVGIVSGDLNQMSHRERVEGFKDYLRKEPAMKIEFIETRYANKQMSEEKIKELMKDHPDVGAIFATSAMTGLGLSQEISDKGIKIATVDEQEDSLDALEKGKIDILAAQSGYRIGYKTIEYINDVKNKKGVKKNYYLDAEILTKENVNSYRRRYEHEEYSE